MKAEIRSIKARLPASAYVVILIAACHRTSLSIMTREELSKFCGVSAFMRRTTPIEPYEPVEPLSWVIKGRNALGLTQNLEP